MGLFKKTKKEKLKEISRYSILEEYNIDLTETKDSIEKIGETTNYIFYLYKPEGSILDSKYFLRQNKDNAKNIVYFGNMPSHACLFEDYLFCAYKTGEMDRYDYIEARNIENGNILTFNWLGKNGNMVYINGYGRPHNQDTINSMNVNENKLIIEVHREKGTVYEKTDRNYEMNYTIVVEYKNGVFLPTYFYEEEKMNSKRQFR